MKKLFYLVITLPLFFVSCSDDDVVDEFENIGNITGTWAFQTTTADVETSDGTLSLVVNPLLETALKSYAESQEATYYVFDEEGQYEAYLTEISEETKISSGTYTLGETSLSLVDETNSEYQDLEIVIANNNTLKLKKDYSNSVAYWGAGIIGDYVGISVTSATATFTYTKE